MEDDTWKNEPQLEEEIDTLNDETFGVDVNNLTNEWEQVHTSLVSKEIGAAKEDLPDFFKTQASDGFKEESLEEDNTLKDEMLPSNESAFPTQNTNNDQEFFFLDTETEANANLDSQMESMFHLVLEDEEEPNVSKSNVASHSFDSFGSPTMPSIWSTKSPLSRSPASRYPVTNAPPQQQPAPVAYQQYPAQSNPPQEQAQPGNPLYKFFGPGAVPQNIPATTAPNLADSKVRGMLSVEELEARLTASKPQAVPIATEHPPPVVTMPPQQQPFYQQALSPQGPPMIPPQQQPVPTTTTNFARPSPPFNNQIRPLQTKSASSPQQFLQFRPRWKESKKLMSAEEIDSIIRMQELQLHSNNNMFAEDYYFITANRKREKENSFINHKPLFESSPRIPIKKLESFEGVLGRIPIHSVRAPRPLIQLKQTENGNENPEGSTTTTSTNTPTTADASKPQSSKAIHSLLLAIENAYNCLLDIEDIDDILKRPESVTYFNIGYMRQKREEFTNELFKLLHIYATPYGTLPQRHLNLPEDQPIYPEDEIFINMTLIQKGRKLIMRVLPVLFQYHLCSAMLVYLRNLALLISSPHLYTDDMDGSTKLFNHINDVLTISPISHTILYLQTLLAAHTDAQLIKLLQSKFGLNILQTLLKRGHDLNLSPFGRDEVPIPDLPPMQFPPLVTAGLHWKEAVLTLMKRLQGAFIYLFHSEYGNTPKIWEFFAVLVVNIAAEQKKKLLSELREVIQMTPVNSTLIAFLQLAGADQIIA